MGMNTGMAMVITAQQPPTANTVSATRRNASGAMRYAGTALPMPLMRMSNSPSARLASLSISPKPTTMAMLTMPLAPAKKWLKYSPTVMRLRSTYSRNCTTSAMIIPCSRSLSKRTVPPTSAASGIMAFHAEETLSSSTSAMSTSFSAEPDCSKGAPPDATRRYACFSPPTLGNAPSASSRLSSIMASG